MEMSFENKMNMAFDKPLKYKELLLYPGTLSCYPLFSNADSFLDCSRLEEKDKHLLRLSYLDYMYEKSLKDSAFQYNFAMMNYIIQQVLKSPFDLIKEDGKLHLKVYQKAPNYDLLKEKQEKIKNEILDTYKEGKVNSDKLKEIDNLNNEMYNYIFINSEEFDDIRHLIMIQNDIVSEHYPSHIEEILYETKEKLRKINKEKITEFEDLITAVAFTTGLKVEDMYNMTIRRFNRYLKLTTDKSDYYLYKHLELGGKIEIKKDLDYWLSHYEPKGKFDDALIKDSSLLSTIKEGKN